MARKGENIYKRKDGRWEARYVKSRRSGKTVYGYVYGKSYLEVKNKRNEVIAGLKDSAESLENCTDQPSLRRLSEMWLDSLRPSRKASTIVKYTNQLENHILPAFGDKCLSDINNEAMIQFGNILQKSDGKGLSSKSAYDIISRMKSIRKYALLHGYDVGFIPECITITQQLDSIRVLSMEEEKVLLDYVRGTSDLTGLGILICLFTGLRIGELCALT